MADGYSENFGSITDVDTGETLRFDINPEKIQESASANFARQQIPGLSHQRSQFINTNNKPFTFDLVFDGNIKGGYERVEEARQYLLSCVYPRGATKIEGAGASLFLLMIPGTIKAVGYVDTVDISHELFYSDLKLRAFRASITFTEELQVRTTKKKVRSTRNNRPQTRKRFNFR